MTRNQQLESLGNISRNTLANWRKTKPELVKAMEHYLDNPPAPSESSLNFRRVDDKAWFLLDQSTLTAHQRESVIEILQLSTRDRRDFEGGGRFEIEVTKEEISSLLKILNRS